MSKIPTAEALVKILEDEGAKEKKHSGSRKVCESVFLS